MKNISLRLAVLLLIWLLSGCGNAQSARPQADGSMKGYELYSWQEAAAWKFSLLVGTNREKTLGEIKAPLTALSGVDALKARLGEIPAGQYVTWSIKETLAFPPAEIIQQVQEFGSTHGQFLNIIK